jgi:hypothetical protein
MSIRHPRLHRSAIFSGSRALPFIHYCGGHTADRKCLFGPLVKRRSSGYSNVQSIVLSARGGQPLVPADRREPCRTISPEGWSSCAQMVRCAPQADAPGDRSSLAIDLARDGNADPP